MSISLWETEEDVCNVVSGTTFLVPGSVRFLVILTPQVTGTCRRRRYSAGHPRRSENDRTVGPASPELKKPSSSIKMSLPLPAA
jgi:hypothetical protein